MIPEGAITTHEELEEFNVSGRNVYLVVNWDNGLDQLLKITLTTHSKIEKLNRMWYYTNTIINWNRRRHRPDLSDCAIIRDDAFAFTNYWLAYAQKLRVLKKLEKEGLK